MRPTESRALAARRQTVRRPRRGITLATLTLAMGTAPPALAHEPPSDIRYDDGVLSWRSNAPSINVYEDGVYTLTLHGASRLEGAREGALYQLVAHDRGRDFSPYSRGIVAGDDDEDEDEDEDEIEWDEARVYFELNDTDGDLGFHSLFDGEPWDRAIIEDPSGEIILRVEPRGRLAAQGVTEIFFESAEPTFDELDPADFFARFPEGEYEIEGRTLEGEELESEWTLSHVLPAAPANLAVSGAPLPASCEEEDGPFAMKPLTLVWDPVTHSHPTLGRAGEVEIDRYQVVLEREEPTPLNVSIDVEPTVTMLMLPNDLIGPDEAVKVEVLAIEANGNQVATESCFVSVE